MYNATKKIWKDNLSEEKASKQLQKSELLNIWSFPRTARCTIASHNFMLDHRAYLKIGLFY